MKLNKTIALYFLCFAAMVPVFLSAAFLGGRLFIRIVMLKALESDQVITVKLDASKVRWYKLNHELIIDGRMFDVKSLTHEEGYLIVSGLFDDMETDMNEQLEKNHESGSGHSKSSHSIYQVCLGIVGIKNHVQSFMCALPVIGKSFTNPVDQLQVYDTGIIPPSPPPES